MLTRTIFALSTLFPSAAALAQAHLDSLGLLPSADWCAASLLSNDGRVVVGSGGTNSGDPALSRVFRWTPAGGIRDAAPTTLLPEPATPFDMSADGDLIVGSYSVNGASRGFRLHVASQTIDILTIPSSSNTTTTVISGDGATMAMYCSGCTGSRAYRWNGGAYTNIPLPSGVGTAWLEPRCMTPDGSVIVGTVRRTTTSPMFKWTAAAGAVVLAMPSDAAYVQPYGISDDGQTIVGDYLTSTNQREAFRWTAAGGGVAIVPVGSGSSSRALACTADGRSVVGSYGPIGSSRAYEWTVDNGLMILSNVLLAGGADLSDWVLSSASAISPDGSAIAGDGFHAGSTEGWRATFGPPPCVADFDDGTGTGTPDGGVTIEDLLYYLQLFAAGDGRADIDNGTGTGTHDGGVTIEDLLFFLTHYAAGC